MNTIKKGIITLGFIILALPLWALGSDIVVDPISLIFNYDKGEVQQTVNIRNVGKNLLVCTPNIFNDPLFVNGEYYLGNNITCFPTQVVLAPDQSANINVYVYDVDQLPSDGEYDAVLRVDSKFVGTPIDPPKQGASFALIQQGVVALYKGELIQSVALTDFQVVEKTVSGSSALSKQLQFNIDNKSNVHIAYEINYSLYDAQGNVVGDGVLRNTMIRNNISAQTLSITNPQATKAVLSLDIQKIQSSKLQHIQDYTVKL